VNGYKQLMPLDLFESVTECGCAAKVPAQQLSEILRGLAIPTSSAVLVGPETLDDAGVLRLPSGQCLVQTVDFFPPVARHATDYGRIAAANALSDIYAMGGAPLSALAVVCIPSKLVKDGALREMIEGANETLRKADCALLGGHSVLDTQAKFGFAVTGLVDPKAMFTNSCAHPGDVLILTKAIGTGATIMAIRAGLASIEQEERVNSAMSELNKDAANLARAFGVSCATDITGFGLLGHALQLARASGVSIEIDISGIPFLNGALEFASQGLLSAATYNNRAYVGRAVEFDDTITLAEQDLLFDPQTSGGLFVCCPEPKAAEFLARAKECLGTPCGIVGRVVEKSEASLIRVIKGTPLTAGKA
jgi:selenide, water dikinase